MSTRALPTILQTDRLAGKDPQRHYCHNTRMEATMVASTTIKASPSAYDDVEFAFKRQATVCYSFHFTAISNRPCSLVIRCSNLLGDSGQTFPPQTHFLDNCYPYSYARVFCGLW